MRASTRLAVAGSALLLALATGAHAQAARQPAWDQVVAAAKKEGELVMYGSGSPQAHRQVADAFKKAYGITLKFTILPSGSLESRLNAEMKSGRGEADFVATAGTAFAQKLAQAGHLENLDSLPAAKGYPRKYWHSQYPAITMNVANILYNTANVRPEDVPKSWRDLEKPRWKNRIGMRTTEAGLTQITVYHELYKKFGEDFFKGLSQNNPKGAASPVAAASMLTAGEFDIMFPSYSFAYQELKSKGAPVGEAFLDLNIGYVKLLYVLKTAKHKNAALLMANWSLTPEGQQAWNGNHVGGSPLGNLPGTLAFPEDSVIGDQEAVAPKVGSFLELMAKYRFK